MIPSSFVLRHPLILLPLLLVTGAYAYCADDAVATGSQQTDLLTLEAIYRDRNYQGEVPDTIRWLEDGSGYTVLETQSAFADLDPEKDEEGEDIKAPQDIVLYRPDTLERTVLISAAQLTPTGHDQALVVDNYSWSTDRRKLLIYTNSQRVWRVNSRGDYWLLDLASNELWQLGMESQSDVDEARENRSDEEESARRENAGLEEGLVPEENGEDVEGPEPREIGENVEGLERSEAGSNKEELDAKENDEATMMFAKFSDDGSKLAYVRNSNLYVQDLADRRITQLTHDAATTIINGHFDWAYEEEFGIRDGFRWSPDGNRIAYWQFDTSAAKEFFLINNTDTLYPTITSIPYPKVGEENSAARIGIVSLASGTTTWLALPGVPKDMYVPRMDWAANSDEVLVQQLNRKQDTNTMFLANVHTGDLQTLLVERENEYIERVYDLEWIADGEAFIWVSERNDWRHIFRVSRDGESVIDLTPGDFDIASIAAIDDEAGWIYFLASPDNVTQRYLYRTSIDGAGDMQRITPDAFSGSNAYQISADGHWAIHTHSAFAQPPRYTMVSLPDHKLLHVVEDNAELLEKLAPLSFGDHEFFQVAAQDGLTLDGIIMRPPDFDLSRKYPIVFFVYGEPASQTVRDTWGGTNWLWHRLLTQQGFIVASIDNRGSAAPRGRAWRRSIYGAVGVLGSRDQADALQAMTERWPYIDSSRVGVWGHSGGGTMTLNLMFRYPEQYHVGIAGAPVADQRLYDSIYQERYSGLLEQFEDSYRESSAITHAANLKGKLLLIHGTGDDNVHYQGTERLINELIKNNRQFDLMSYPNRTHGISNGAGTTLHRFTLMTNYFVEHLGSE